jgi:hypothetical protein
MSKTPPAVVAVFFTACLLSTCLLSNGCGTGGTQSSLDDESLAALYAELSVAAAGDSLKARTILDSLDVTPEQFVAAISEKADDLKEWQAIHEAAIRKIDLAALKEERQRGVTNAPLR